MFQTTNTPKQPMDMDPLPALSFLTEDSWANFASESTMFNVFVSDDDVSGFSFSTLEEFHRGLQFLKTRGFPENWQLDIRCQFGDPINRELASLFQLDQTNIEAFLDALNDWTDERKIQVIIAITDTHYVFQPKVQTSTHYGNDPS